MNTNTEGNQENRHIVEIVKWIIAFLLLFTAIVGNYLYYDMNFPIRAFAIIILISIAGIIILSTKKGKSLIAFSHDARVELRKVIWPTHQETLHITLAVVAITFFISLILWGLDGILIRLISFITNLRF